MNNQQQRDDIARILFKYHSHAQFLLKFEIEDEEANRVMIDPSAIIYTEEQVVALLNELGYPEPDWTYWDRDPKNPKNKTIVTE